MPLYFYRPDCFDSEISLGCVDYLIYMYMIPRVVLYLASK